MTNDSINQTEKEIADIIEILTFLNYDGTVSLNDVDLIDALQ
ncbi:MAG: hypothetical protein ACFFB2_15495 [Promethearchaeota archaeon]